MPDWLDTASEHLADMMLEHTSQSITYRSIGGGRETISATPLTFKQMQKHVGEEGYKPQNTTGVSYNCSGFVINKTQISDEPRFGDRITITLSGEVTNFRVAMLPDGEPWMWFDSYKRQYIIAVVED